MASDQQVKLPKSSKELANAAYDDFKRKAIDEAKKRAVAQHVDYDTFKNMVLVAHLKPLQTPSEAKTKGSMPSWSFNADGSRAAPQHNAAGQLTSNAPTTAPTTSGDFTREWQRSCPTPDVKYAYLKLCGPDLMRTLFKVEIQTHILKDVLAVLDACWLGHAGASEEAEGGAALREAVFVTDVLTALAGVGRFSLSLKLLGSSGQAVLLHLFDDLQSAAQAIDLQEELTGLRSVYELPTQ